MTGRTWWLPPGLPVPATASRDLGGVVVEDAAVTPALVREAAAALTRARPALIALRTDAILRALDETLAGWLAPDAADAKAAAEAFRAATGMPAATAPFAPLLEALAGGRLRAWVRAEVDPFEALDGFAPGRDGRPVRALGPALAVHVLPGNVPLVWLPSVLACLVMRTPCLLKPAADDPITPALFAAAVARRLPALGNALAVLPWERGGEAETAALGAAGAVVVYGGDEAVRAIAAKTPPEARLAVHGPRFAAGAVAKEMVGPGRLEPVAAAAARDALLYDGCGCLSLAVVYLEHGGLFEVREAAQLFARALQRTAAELPPGRPDRDAAALTQTWRARLKARVLAGKPALLFTSPGGLDWTLAYDEELPCPATPLVRTLWLTPVAILEEIPGRLARDGSPPCHALAYAGPEARRAPLLEMLARRGLTRAASFGALQSPPLSWPHGGASPFKRLLSWTAVEK